MDDNSNLHQYEWYYGKINRQEAEENLIDRGENEGCFLVRESQSRAGKWTISVLDWMDGGCNVGHYLISQNHHEEFYLEEERQFRTIADLIQYYKANPESVNFVLREACPREVRIPEKDADEYDLYEVATELPKDETFQRETLISSGTSYDVWKGHLISCERIRVVAKIVKEHTDSEHILIHETNILKCLNHENVVRMRGVLSITTPFHLVQEWAGDTNLIGLLLNSGLPELSLMEQLNISIQVASALNYCEKMKCVHRNVKAKSIIVNSVDLKCRLASFKHAGIVDKHGYFHSTTVEHKYATVHSSRIRWMSLEAAKHGRYSHASDVWSFAILLVEIMTGGALPYAGYLTSRILEEIEDGYRCAKPPSCPMEIYRSMHQCWMTSEKDRPNFSAIKAVLIKYREDNHETLVKLMPAKSRDHRYASWKHRSVKQQRTSIMRHPASKLPAIPQYGYDN